MNCATCTWLHRLVATGAKKSQKQLGILIHNGRCHSSDSVVVLGWHKKQPSLPSSSTWYGSFHAMRSISFFRQNNPAEQKELADRKKEEEEQQADRKKFSMFDYVTGYVRGRSEKDTTKQMKAQIDLMANLEVWTLGDFEKTLDDQLQSWSAKAVSWFSNSNEMKIAKQAQTVVKGIIDQVGKDATVDVIEQFGRKEKLKLAYSSGASPEDINTLFLQFHSTSLMHRVIRNRKANGKPLPYDNDTLRVAMQLEGKDLLSKEQVKIMRRRQFGDFKKMLRSPRR